MAEFLSPSIQVVELREGPGDVQGVSTSTGSFFGEAEKGPVNEPKLITSFTQYQEIFGTFISTSFLAEQVDAFFRNGGARCYVIRIAHYNDISDPATLTAVKATRTLLSAAGGATAGFVTGSNNAPFDLESGQTLTIAVDGGGAGTATFDAAAATHVGSGGTFATMASETMEIQLEGGPVQLITFGTESTIEEAVNLINTQLSGGFAAVNAGQVDITSDVRGTSSRVRTTNVAAGITTKLGIANSGDDSGSGDVANIDAVTHAEAKAVIEADVTGLTYTPSTGSGTPATLTSNTTGASSSIEVTGGTAQTAFGLPGGVNSGSDSASPANTIKVDASSEGVHGNELALTTTREDTIVTRLQTTLSAGAATEAALISATQLRAGDFVVIRDTSNLNEIRVLITATAGRTIKFASITVPAGDINAADSQVLRERFTIKVETNGEVTSTFSELAIDSTQKRDYFVTRINNTENTPILVTDLSPAVPDPRPAAAASQTLSGGTDGDPVVDTDYVGSEAGATGLRALDRIDAVNLLSVPGINTVTVQRAILDYGELRRDLFGILTVPLGLTPQQALDYVTGTANLASSYAAIYYPHLKILHPLTGVEENTPVDGFAQGIYARTDRNRNVAKAPAGTVDGRVSGITGLEREVSQGEYDILYPANINAVLSITGGGISLFGSRTLESGSFRQIPVRRLFLFVEESLAESSRFVLFEPNNRETRAKVARLYKGFLRNLRLARMLKGDSDEEAFFVIVNEQNNPPSVVNSGLMKARVGIAVSKPTEFLQIEVQEKTAEV